MTRNRIFGLILLLIAIIIPIYNNKKETYNTMAAFKEVSSFIERKPSDTSNIRPKYDYIAALEIPEINLLHGLVSKDSPYNDINYNVTIIDGDMPSKDNSNLILAAHNGTSPISFFKDLEGLPLDTDIYLYHDGTKYIYKLTNIYSIPKNGYANIIRNKTKTTLTLITCKNNSDTEQLVFISYLIDKTPY